MVRTIGLLAAALFLLVLTGSAVPPQSYADTTQQAVATADADVNTIVDENPLVLLNEPRRLLLPARHVDDWRVKTRRA